VFSNLLLTIATLGLFYLGPGWASRGIMPSISPSTGPDDTADFVSQLVSAKAPPARKSPASSISISAFNNLRGRYFFPLSTRCVDAEAVPSGDVLEIRDTAGATLASIR